MVNGTQVATWWESEKVRDFTKLECGLLGAVFSAVAIGFLMVITSFFS